MILKRIRVEFQIIDQTTDRRENIILGSQMNRICLFRGMLSGIRPLEPSI